MKEKRALLPDMPPTPNVSSKESLSLSSRSDKDEFAGERVKESLLPDMPPTPNTSSEEALPLPFKAESPEEDETNVPPSPSSPLLSSSTTYTKQILYPKSSHLYYTFSCLTGFCILVGTILTAAQHPVAESVGAGIATTGFFSKQTFDTYNNTIKRHKIQSYKDRVALLQESLLATRIDETIEPSEPPSVIAKYGLNHFFASYNFKKFKDIFSLDTFNSDNFIFDRYIVASIMITMSILLCQAVACSLTITRSATGECGKLSTENNEETGFSTCFIVATLFTALAYSLDTVDQSVKNNSLDRQLQVLEQTESEIKSAMP